MKIIYLTDIICRILIWFVNSIYKKIPQILPVKYDWQRVNDSFANELKEKYKNEEVIGLCAVSKKEEKDIPLESAVDIVKRLIKILQRSNFNRYRYNALSMCRPMPYMCNILSNRYDKTLGT